MEADTFTHGDVSKAHTAAGMVYGAPVRSQPWHRWRVLPFFSMLCSWWHFCFLSWFSKTFCTHRTSISPDEIIWMSFSSSQPKRRLTVLCSILCSIPAHLGAAFWKLCFWMLALLVTWCARPCVLDRLCWFFLFDQVPDNVQSDKESRFAICMP